MDPVEDLRGLNNWIFNLLFEKGGLIVSTSGLGRDWRIDKE